MLRLSLAGASALALTACGLEAASSGSAPGAPASRPSSAPSAAASVAATVAAKPSAAASSNVTGKVDVVHQGNLRGVTLEAAIARARGYFAELGIDSQEQIFQSGQQQTPLLATGQIDIGTASVGASLFNSIAQGVKSKVVVDGGHLEKGIWSYGYLLRADVADSIKSVADIKGKTIACISDPKQGGNGFSAARMLATVGLTVDDVKWSFMPLPQEVQALQNKAVDGAHLFEPFVTVATQGGAAVKWQNAADYYPNEAVGFLVFSESFIRDKNDVAKRWMTAFIRGMRDLLEWEKSKKENDVILPVLQKATNLSSDVLPKVQWNRTNPNGAINVQGLLDDQKQLAEWGSIKQTYPIDQVYDSQFVEYAVKQLGAAG